MGEVDWAARARGRFQGKTDAEIVGILEEQLAAAHRETQAVLNGVDSDTGSEKFRDDDATYEAWLRGGDVNDGTTGEPVPTCRIELRGDALLFPEWWGRERLVFELWRLQNRLDFLKGRGDG